MFDSKLKWGFDYLNFIFILYMFQVLLDYAIFAFFKTI